MASVREGFLRTLVAAGVVVSVAVGLAACGGGDSSTNSTAAQAEGQSEPAGQSGGADSKQQDGSKSEEKSGGSGGSSGETSSGNSGSGSAAKFTPKQHKDSGGGSQQYRVKGGDNSVQEFGSESDESEFKVAATALHNFLDARAEGNWDAACQYMSKEMIKSFEKLAEAAKQIDATSCGAILEGLTNPAAKAAMKTEAEKADIGSLRTEGDRAFLIYTTGEKTIYAMPMADEGGTWKVASLAGTPLN
jgi:hypothetical protein